MELLQCVSSSNESRNRWFSTERKSPKSRFASSEDRDPLNTVEFCYADDPDRQQHRNEIDSRSLPAGHYSLTPTMTRGRSEFQHYGSSLSLTNGGTSDLTSRTLRPPSPSTLRKVSTLSSSSSASSFKTLSRPALPNAKIDLESPKLADYLERPRLVSTINCKEANRTIPRSAAEASHHHAKRLMQNETSPYRNLRLGNFMEEEDSDELIPERLRQYYLETYLNVCDTCESLTHCNPVSPIHRGM